MRGRGWWLAILVAVLVAAGCERQRSPSAPTTTMADSGQLPAAPTQIAPAGAAAQILNYDLRVEIIPAKHYLQATARVDWEVLQPTSRLEFHLRPNLEIKSLTDSEGQALRYDRDKDGAVSVRLPEALQAGTRPSLTLQYEGEIYGPRGGYRNRRLWDYIGKEGTYVRSESEWYPQVSGDTATADLKITAPADWLVVSSGQLVDVGERHFHWRTDTPAAGLSFAAAEYVLTESRAGKVPLRCYTFPQHASRAREFLDKAGQIIAFFEKLYGPYPFPKFSLAEIPDLSGGGHGDQSLVMLQAKTFRDSLDEEFLARELAYNWWGGQIICTESKFPVEGFATYSQALWREHTGRKAALQKAMKQQAEPVLRASLDSEGQKSCYASETGPLLYQKGSWILHMSRQLLGDEAWFRAVRKFATEHAGQVITVAQLREALEAGHGQSLEKFFQQWVYGTGVPWIKGAVVAGPGGKARVRLSQVFVAGKSKGEAGAAWRTAPSSFDLLVDVVVKHEGGETRRTVRLTEPSADYEIAVPGKVTSLVIDPAEWLLDHSKGLTGELDQEMEALQKDLERELGEDVKGPPR